MSKITFQCYACNQTLKVAADKAGKKAKCIKCQTILTIPVASDQPPAPATTPPPPQTASQAPPTPSAPPPSNDLDFTAEAPPPPPAPPADDYDEDYDERPRRKRRRRDEDEYDDSDEEDYDERPRKRRRRSEDDYDEDHDDYDVSGARKSKEFGTWSKMRLGCYIAFIGMLVYGGAFALEQLAVLILTFASFATRGSEGLITTIGVICRIGIVVSFGAFIGTLVGYVFWIFGKNRNNSMIWAIVTVSVAGISAIWLLIFRFIPIFPPASTTFGGFRVPTSGIFSHMYLFMAENYGVFAAARPVGDVILTIMVQLFLHATWMMSAFYLWTLGKTLRDRDFSRRGMMIIILTGCSAGYQIIWPLLIRAFRGASTLGAAKGIIAIVWLMYWIGIGLIVTIIIMLILNYRRAKQELE